MKNTLIMIFLLLCLSIVGCGTEAEVESNLSIASHVDFSIDDYEKIVAPNNDLGFKLLQEVEADETGNKFISPTSLMMALGMVYNGAEDETKEEIAKALQAKEISVESLNESIASLMTLLDKETSHIKVDVANSIWLNDTLHFQDSFEKQTQDYFNAEVLEVNMTDSHTPQKINDWVSKQTNETIEEIVDELNPSTVALLINAIYFKGDWTYPFDKKQTEERTFHLENGSRTDVPMMFLKEELPYLETETFRAVSLPYSEGEMTMQIFLPKKDSDLESLQAELTSENWEIWQSKFQTEKGTVLLPKFKLEYETTLVQPLIKLGMVEPFNAQQAEFPHMIEENGQIFISDIKQKTFLDVYEEGTEASAVTNVEMKMTSAPVNEPFYMEVNHPFLVTITDNETDAIIFIGTIKQPS